jgi:hypothetical protein
VWGEQTVERILGEITQIDHLFTMYAEIMIKIIAPFCSRSPLPPLPSQGEGEPPHWAHRRVPLHQHTTTGDRDRGSR